MNRFPESISRWALAPVLIPRKIPHRPVFVLDRLRHTNVTDDWLNAKQPGLAPKRLISATNISRWALAPVTHIPTFDLSVKNPDGGEEVIHRSPEDIMDEIAALDAESAEVLLTIRGLL